MATTKIYDELLAQITDDLERQVLMALMSAPAGISRSRLIHKIYNIWVPAEELANSRCDRKILLAIESLRKDWPIVSSSGEAGYKLTEDRAEIDAYAAEQASRAARETEKARQAHSWPAKIRPIQEFRKSGVNATQEALL